MQSKFSQVTMYQILLKKNQDVRRSLGDYEAIETILRAGALKQSSLLGSDLLPCVPVAFTTLRATHWLQEFSLVRCIRHHSEF